MNPFFLFEYKQCKDRFSNYSSVIDSYWSNRTVQSFSLKDETTMDLIHGIPQEADKLLLITTGLHGIEGYIGDAMMELFIREYVMKLHHQKTGICLIHGINGWGMKHFRKANEHNIDLNRNFVWDWTDTPSLVNEPYQELNELFHPRVHYSNRMLQTFSIAANLGIALRRWDKKTITRSVTLGQYVDPQGVYYGGTDYEKVTKSLIEIFKSLFSSYKSIVMLDIHTGYGPKDNMYLVNSRFELRNYAELTQQLNYPFITTSNPEEFYEINGDMIDYVYRLQQEKFPEKHLFATTLEFGTLGDSLYGQLKSLQATIEENDVYFKSRGNKNSVSKLYQKLYAPENIKWQTKAIEDCRRLFQGVLSGFSL